MTSKYDYVTYAPLPAENAVVLPLYYHPNRHRHSYLRRCLYSVACVAILAFLVFLLYPSDPTIQLSRIRLNHIRVNSSPGPTLDLSFCLTIKVQNRDFFSLSYDSLAVSVGYRGRELGLVRSKGGKVRARGRSYVNATLELDGLEIIHDAFYLIEDLTKGVIPFDTDTEVKGQLGLLFFEIPLKARVECEVYVNTNDQSVVRQDCYPA
ncbi:uncharacterized protein LOC116127951 [Pistacia vera]|uniref:uncharacterized protein LOC116127951 n=1 Tax=Pistacia vera TaxID=55513 RepID=UPI001262CB39|nr:uncharacterized protein LOC116127951 [Pistacia vera]